MDAGASPLPNGRPVVPWYSRPFNIYAKSEEEVKRWKEPSFLEEEARRCLRRRRRQNEVTGNSHGNPAQANGSGHTKKSLKDVGVPAEGRAEPKVDKGPEVDAPIGVELSTLKEESLEGSQACSGESNCCVDAQLRKEIENQKKIIMEKDARIAQLEKLLTEKGSQLNNALRTSASRNNAGVQKSQSSGTKLFPCSRCPLSFSQKIGLQKHVDAVHERKKPFSCGICDKSFSRKAHMQVHMRVHTQEKPFCCPVCSKRFGKKGNLDQHVKSVHEKVRPFGCERCGRKFSQKSHKKKHQAICKGSGLDVAVNTNASTEGSGYQDEAGSERQGATAKVDGHGGEVMDNLEEIGGEDVIMVEEIAGPSKLGLEPSSDEAKWQLLTVTLEELKEVKMETESGQYPESDMPLGLNRTSTGALPAEGALLKKD